MPWLLVCVRRDADMTVDFLASLHNAKHLRKLLVDGEHQAHRSASDNM